MIKNCYGYYFINFTYLKRVKFNACINVSTLKIQEIVEQLCSLRLYLWLTVDLSNTIEKGI